MNMQRQSSVPSLRLSHRLLLVLVNGAALSLLGHSGQAATVFITSGQNNPTAAGAVAVFSAGAPVVTTSSGNDGEDFWRLHSGPYPGDSGVAHYTYFMTAANTTEPSRCTLTDRARITHA